MGAEVEDSAVGTAVGISGGKEGLTQEAPQVGMKIVTEAANSANGVKTAKKMTNTTSLNRTTGSFQKAERSTWTCAMAPLAFALFAAACESAATAGPSHPHQDIVDAVKLAAIDDATAEGFDTVEVNVRPLDRRLRPALCGEALQTIRPKTGRAIGAVSYGVRCGSPVPWTLYLRADVAATMELPVLRQALPRGSLLAESDLELAVRRISSRSADLVMSMDSVVGLELKRPVAAGVPLRHGQVARPKLISRGQQVTLVAGTSGLQVRMQGKALAGGAEGDRLLVQNTSSGRRLEGVVLPDGSVRVR
ncbi:MAG: flagellar basal body P-ring formation chaperone FlgA [Pseudomonadota bacterium]